MMQLYIPFNPQLDFSLFPKGHIATFGIEVEGYLPPPLGVWGRKLSWMHSDCPTNLIIPNDDFVKHYANKFEKLTGFPKTLKNKFDGVWSFGKDGTIVPEEGSYGIEVRTPILKAMDGFEAAYKGLKALCALKVATNRTCGLHAHLSLGWHPVCAPYAGRDTTLLEAQNVCRAYSNNMSFFNTLVAEHRLTNSHCSQPMPDELLEAPTPQKFLEAMGKKDIGNDIRPSKLVTPGTLEYRKKEADNFLISLGYVQFMTAFTCLAAQDPQINPEQILSRHFAPVSIRPSTPVNKAVLKRATALPLPLAKAS